MHARRVPTCRQHVLHLTSADKLRPVHGAALSHVLRAAIASLPAVPRVHPVVAAPSRCQSNGQMSHKACMVHAGDWLGCLAAHDVRSIVWSLKCVLCSLASLFACSVLFVCLLGCLLLLVWGFLPLLCRCHSFPVLYIVYIVYILVTVNAERLPCWTWRWWPDAFSFPLINSWLGTNDLAVWIIIRYLFPFPLSS